VIGSDGLTFIWLRRRVRRIVPAERGAYVAATDRARGVRRLPLHEQPDSARSTLKDQLIILKCKHTWVISWLYIGTFGSFIGYSAAFPLLLKTQFPAITVGVAFIGPLVDPSRARWRPARR